jgi:hypothetical protein
MPGLVEQFDTMQACSDPSSQAAMRLDLLQKCWEHDRQLERWFSVISQLGHLRHNNPLSECCSDNLVVRITQVHGMSLFYTMGLVLYSILRMAAGPQANLQKRVDPLHHATRLAEAIRILLQPSAGLYRQQSAALPLEVALKYSAALGSFSSRGGRLLENLSRMRTGTR